MALCDFFLSKSGVDKMVQYDPASCHLHYSFLKQKIIALFLLPGSVIILMKGIIILIGIMTVMVMEDVNLSSHLIKLPSQSYLFITPFQF